MSSIYQILNWSFFWSLKRVGSRKIATRSVSIFIELEFVGIEAG